MTTAIRDRRLPVPDLPTPPAKRLLTAQEYLAIERNAETKSEFYCGEMIPMPGAKWKHNQLNGNLNFNLRLALSDEVYSVLSSDMRVRIPATGLYTYPDVLVCQGEPELEEAELDVLTNPCFIAEILSKSTEKYDRGAKFEHYKTLDSLREYLLLAQDRIAAELYEREADGNWSKQFFEGTESVLRLSALGVEIPMAKLYAGVKLDS